jgi:hypothetical protein
MFPTRANIPFETVGRNSWCFCTLRTIRWQRFWAYSPSSSYAFSSTEPDVAGTNETRNGRQLVDNPIILLVAVVVLIVIFGQAYVWWRAIEKRRADGTLGKPVRLTRGAWIALAFVAVFLVIIVVAIPLLDS